MVTAVGFPAGDLKEVNVADWKELVSTANKRSAMSRIRTAMLLGFILGLLSPTHGHAEVWRCHQTGGPDLFTDRLQDPRTCQKYELGADINFVPSSSTTTLPGVVPSQPLPAAEPPPPTKTRREVPEPSTQPY